MIDSLFLNIVFRFFLALIAWIAALFDVVCDVPLPSATETKITKLFVNIKSLAITHKYIHTHTYVCVQKKNRRERESETEKELEKER